MVMVGQADCFQPKNSGGVCAQVCHARGERERRREKGKRVDHRITEW